MEFFEKAHVVSKKSNREESKKRQLKQMLQGYKHNDNYAIKSSANQKILPDESFSGFSESNFNALTQERSVKVSPGHEDTIISDTEDEDLESSYSISSKENSAIHSPLSSNKVSTLEYDQETVSLSENSIQAEQTLPFKENENDVSFSSGNSIETLSEDSEPFDPEGTLAMKIKQQLGKRANIIEPPKSMKKVKSYKPKKVDDNWMVEDMSHMQISKYVPDEPSMSPDGSSDKSLRESSSSDSDKSSSNRKRSGSSNIKSSKSVSFKKILRKSTSSDSDKSSSNSSSDSKSSDSESISSNKIESGSSSFSGTVSDSSSQVNDEVENTDPFVTMQAPEFYCGSLSAILSDYKCPITRVLPCEKTTSTMASSKIFTSDIVDTGLIGSDEDIDNEFVDQFDTNIDCSVIDETETATEDPSLLSQEIIITSEDTLINEEVQDPEELQNSLTELVKVYYSLNDSCILVMRHPAEIHIHGMVRVTALGGTAEMLGFTLKDKHYDMFAPYYNYAQYLRTVERDTNNYGLFGKLTTSGLTVAEAEEIVTTMNNHDVVVKLQKLHSRQMEFVEENFTNIDLFRKQSKYIDSCFVKASQMLGCSLYLNAPWKNFYENPAWRNIVRGTDAQSRGIITGGKGTGKSTFLRYCVNGLLSAGCGEVLVVDLDPGQCEFTPAGSVSATRVAEPLLGPSYTHMKTPDEMLNIGAINVMDNLTRYTNAVASLIAYCAAEPRYQNIPWVVNTMGLCNTVGLKIITLIILKLKPTFLVQMDSKNAKKRFEQFLNPHSIKSLYFEQYRRNAWFQSVYCSDNFDFAFYVSEERAHGGRAQPLPPRDERYLNYLAYFGELLAQNKDVDFLGITPYKVPLERFRIGSNVKFEEEAIIKVINGKILALCEDDAGDNRGKLFTLTDKPLRCHGYGLVRCADDCAEGAKLYVATPAARAALVRVHALLLADWVPELRVQTGLAAGTPLPYRTASSQSHKQLMLTPRRRFNPLQLLKMSRST